MNLPNKQQVIDYLLQQEEEITNAGYIPTIEMVVEALEREISKEEPCATCHGERKVTYNMGHDDEYTTDCPDCVAHAKGDMDDDSVDLN